MKRSRAIRLVLRGGAGFAPGSSDQAAPRDTRFVADARSCAEAHDEATCQKRVRARRPAGAFRDEDTATTRDPSRFLSNVLG